MNPPRIPSALLLLLPSLALTGCTLANTATNPLDTAPAALSGHLFGGQQPIAGATVTVYAVGSSGYGTGATALASTTTDSAGVFQFGGVGSSYNCPADNTPVYLVATGSADSTPANPNLALMAALGDCSAAQSAGVNLNEVTTAATVFALGQFMNTTLGPGVTPQIGGTCYSSGTTVCAAGTYNQGLVNAMNNTYPQLVDNTTGTAVASSVSGSMTITTEASKLYTIANILASCVNSTGEASTTETSTNCGQLFYGVNATSANPRPYTTIQAALMMDLYPSHNIAKVFDLAAAKGAPFIGLATAPNDWTLGISYTTSSLGLGILPGTSSNLDIDTAGNVWFPSNKPGAVGLADFSPSTTAFSGPSASVNLIYPQYVAIDTSSPAYAWVTDLFSGQVNGAPTLTGSVLLFGTGGAGAGPIAVDSSNNVLTVEGTTLNYISQSRYLGTPATNAITPATGISMTPGQDYAHGGAVFASDPSSTCEEVDYTPGSFNAYAIGTAPSRCYTGGALAVYVSGATSGAFYNIVGFAVDSTQAQLCDDFTEGCNSIGAGADLPEGIAIDGAGHLWLANSGNASVSAVAPSYNNNTFTTAYSAISPSGYLHGANYGDTMTTPYGIAIDRSGNVWVSNAGCVSLYATGCSATSFTLSEIVGAATPILTPTIAAQNAAAAVAASGYSRPTR